MDRRIYSLFIGRWQPFHKGHKALIQTALDRGKNVCIAIRDTLISEKDPHTVEERQAMILKAFEGYGDRIKIIVIPDIDEVLYGRDVGYKVKQISLSRDLHNISGTRIRNGEIQNELDH